MNVVSITQASCRYMYHSRCGRLGRRSVYIGLNIEHLTSNPGVQGWIPATTINFHPVFDLYQSYVYTYIYYIYPYYTFFNSKHKKPEKHANIYIISLS